MPAPKMHRRKVGDEITVQQAEVLRALGAPFGDKWSTLWPKGRVYRFTVQDISSQDYWNWLKKNCRFCLLEEIENDEIS